MGFKSREKSLDCGWLTLSIVVTVNQPTTNAAANISEPQIGESAIIFTCFSTSPGILILKAPLHPLRATLVGKVLPQVVTQILIN